MSEALKISARRNFFWKILRAGFLFFMLGTVELFAQRPLGCDVSGYQPSVNWTQVTNAGVKFAWSKATEGTYYVNPYFTSQESGAKGAGVYIGAYHYARPSVDTNLTGALSADTEAAYFWSTASNYVKGGGGYLVPMLDWEDIHATNGYGGFTGFTATFMSAWVNEWCNSVSNRAAAAGVVGVRPIVYTGTWYSQPSSSYPGLTTAVINWPNWMSSYNGQNPQTGAPTTYPWSSWNVWQYNDTNTSVANWTGGDVDVFNGTASGFGSLVIGGLNAPYLTSQPILNRAVDTGGSVSFAATATGNAPLKYQWTLNGANVLNATNATLNLTNATTTNSGFYTLIVTNSSGSVTSSPVSLLVYPQQVVVFADNFDVNTATNWMINKSSGDNAVTFNFDYSTLEIPSAPNSTNGTTLGVQMKANLSLGVVAAVSLSPNNQNFSGDYRVRFDGWINVNGPFPAGGLGSTEFLTAGVGTSGTRTEWTGNASADGFYFSANGDGGSGDTATNTADYNAYAGPTVQLVATGDYWAGTDATARGNGNVYYTTAFPNGAAAPALQQANFPQQSGNLNAGTLGLAWHDVIVSRRANTVDWVIDGIRMATISNATFTASNVFVGFWDPFASLSSNNVINFGLMDNVRVEVPAVAPAFTAQPLAQTVKLGTNITFTAAARGLPTPNFLWRLNGTNILGATNSAFALASVAATNSGNYSVLATNLAGSVVSSNALLALLPPNAAQFQFISASGGAVQISFSGDAVWTYTIEVSTNLTSWSALTNLTSTNGLFNFTAGFTTNAPQQFFRARVGP
jgi:GH25 family lysozyme M1 (1,4-beta-N-acetylmuramidase)